MNNTYLINNKPVTPQFVDKDGKLPDYIEASQSSQKLELPREPFLTAKAMEALVSVCLIIGATSAVIAAFFIIH